MLGLDLSKFNRTSVHKFSSLDDCPFNPVEYSKLKFGDDKIAKKYGYELADRMFAENSDQLLVNQAVVIPSPYNFIKNAATIMTQHFVSRLNHLLVQNQGSHVEFSVIHRKMSYVNDYGFLTQKKRESLIDGDVFYPIVDFYGGKLLVFIDDIFITGTHEAKMRRVIEAAGLKNKLLFGYYAIYQGNKPQIEADLNFAGVKEVEKLVATLRRPGNHIIVRPVKMLLTLEEKAYAKALQQLSRAFLLKVYHGALGEGYYRLPKYQKNFLALQKFLFTAKN